MKTNPLLRGSTAQQVYFIMGTQDFPDISTAEQAAQFKHTLREACAAGVNYFQFRDKASSRLTEEEREKLARTAQAICREFEVPFIVNDDVEMAVRLNAWGVHVGQDDLDAEATKKLLHPEQRLGVSANTATEITAAQAAGADYVGIGPVFETISKADARTAVPPAELDVLRREFPDFPLFAIGGISEENADTVSETGVDALCVISALTRSSDLPRTVQQLKHSSSL